MRAALLLCLAAGCGSLSPPPDEVVEATPAADSCEARALIDDGEDGDSRVAAVGGRGGYLYTFVDSGGSTVAPRGNFTMAAGGANGSARAMRITGRLTVGQDSYAGLGLSFTEPKGAYDAGNWTGISFAARAGADPVAVRVKVPDRNTDPAGGVCSECYNDFGAEVDVTSEWTRYQVAFADLKQLNDWGDPRPDAVDSRALYGVQWQIRRAGAFELWIDDVTFTGCPTP